jgi:hypothetical protein
MPVRPDDPQWLKDAYAEGRIDEKFVSLHRDMIAFTEKPLLGQPLEAESEDDFQDRLVAHAQLLGWRVMAVRRNVCVLRANGSTHRCTPWLYDGEGWLDLTFVRDRLVVAELKSESGRIRPEQEAWLAALKKAGVEAYLWRPSDWKTIEQTLK